MQVSIISQALLPGKVHSIPHTVAGVSSITPTSPLQASPRDAEVCSYPSGKEKSGRKVRKQSAISGVSFSMLPTKGKEIWASAQQPHVPHSQKPRGPVYLGLAVT